jgi:DNA-binding NtrC family response regulator
MLTEGLAMPKIVLIEENPVFRAQMEQNLLAQGYAVTAVASLDEARSLNHESAAGSPVRLKEIERKVIEEALRTNHGNRTHAARQLGISLRKLQYRLKEYGQKQGNGAFQA